MGEDEVVKFLSKWAATGAAYELAAGGWDFTLTGLLFDKVDLLDQ